MQRFSNGSSPQIFRPFVLLFALALHATGAAAQTRDVAGARDFPGIGRFGGSVITGYQVKDFDAARMQGAAFKDGNPADARRLEGRITRIAYRHQSRAFDPRSVAQFRDATGEGRLETLLACDTDACGGIPFTEAIDVLPIPQMWVDGFNYHYYAGRKVEGGRETYASVVVSENNREIYAQLTVAELGAIENKMVDAAAMAKGLGETGHIALYGIYFDTDKTVIKPESRPTLEQIAKLLDGPAAAQRLHRRPHRQPGRLRLQSRSVAAPRRGDRRRAGEELSHRASAAAHRGCGLPRAGGLQRQRCGPRAEPRVELVAP